MTTPHDVPSPEEQRLLIADMAEHVQYDTTDDSEPDPDPDNEDD